MRRQGRTGAVATTMTMLFIAVFAIAAVRLVPAVDASSCSPRDRVVAGLDKLFGEIHRGQAVAGDDSVMELFSSRVNGTWTMLRTLPDGRSCVVATGNGGWRAEQAEVHETAFDI